MTAETPRSSSIIGFGLLALGLTAINGGVWAGLLLTNLRTAPAVPWAAIVMAGILWVEWQYLNGRGWPVRTAAARHRSLRARALTAQAFAWAIAAGLLSIAALTGLWIVLFQLANESGNRLPDFSKYPPATVALSLALAALMGAVTEEAGFRGYLQGALERKFRGGVAIFITCLAIAPAHALTQGFAWATMLFYLFVDAMFGAMARLTMSIVPGIVVHAIGLLTFFTLVWPYDATRRIVRTSGPDAWFWIHLAQAFAFGLLAIVAFVRLAQRRRLGFVSPCPDPSSHARTHDRT
jgi:membrane protease YdiL (CAAX protease family)